MPGTKTAVHNSSAAPNGGKPWFEFRNATSTTEPVEILIYEQIGKDWWTGDGVAAKDFVEQLQQIPQDRQIRLLINSVGGSVNDGLAIYNQLKLRRDKVTARIDGLAASVASWLPLAARSVEMPENAMFMIHDPFSMACGNADEMRKAADVLDKYKDVIVNIYTEKTGRSKKEISDKMAAETWFTGQEAKDFGLVDTVTPAIAISNSAHDLSRFRRVPKALTENSNPTRTAVQDGGQQQNTHMERKKIIALLNKHGVKVDEKATDEQLESQLDAVLNKKPEPASAPAPDNSKVVDLEGKVRDLEAKNQAERKARIERDVDACVTDCRIPANQRDTWVNRAIADESVLNDLRALPIPAKPEPILPALAVNADLREIGNHLAKVQGMDRAVIVNKHRARILEAWNTNTIGSDLKRIVLLQDVVRAFAKRLYPLKQFSTVFSNVPLSREGGLDQVAVPYYALDASSSTDFVAANGYDTFGNTTTSSRKISINKRKYQGMTWDSSTLRRQPYFDIARLGGLKAEKLAVDIWTDVLSVVTNANYSTAAYTGAASTFDSDVVADLKKVAGQAQWPMSGRSLFIDSAYDANLLKDAAIKNSLAFGGSEPVRQGQIPNLFGFDYIENPNIPGNSENLVGFISFASAILIATAPVEPAPEVRAVMSAYEVVTDDATGISLEYRRWGSASLDTAYETIEANYGYLTGEAAALKRIVSA